MFVPMAMEENADSRKKEWWVTGAFFFFSGILGATWTSRIPAIQHKLEVNNAIWGLVLFSVPAGLVTGLSVASWLVAKYGTKQIMLAGCLSIAGLLALTGFASAAVPLMVCLFLAGVCRTVLNIAVNTNAVELQHRYTGPIMSTFHGIWSLACLIAAGISTVMVILFVPPSLQFSIIAIIVAIAASLLLRKRPAYEAAVERRPFFVKPDRYLFLLGIIALCAMLCEGAMFDWSVNYFEKVIKVEKSFSTTGYTAFIVAMASGRLLGDRLVAAFGVYTLLTANGLLMATGFATAAFFPALVPASLGFLLVGFGDSVLVPVIYTLAAQSGRMLPGYAISSVTLIGYTGFLIGPLFIGNVSQHFGMQTTYYCLSAVSLGIIFLTLKIKKEITTPAPVNT